MKTLLILALLTLSACGADGPPVAPGMAVSGQAILGVGSKLN
jgi:predicted small lipoprotein YifL